MKKENSGVTNVWVPSGRVTRARAVTLKENVGATAMTSKENAAGVLKGKTTLQQDQKRPPRPPPSKATASRKNVATASLGKRKAVLQDVTNVLCRSSSCASEDNIRKAKKAKKAEVQVSGVVSSLSIPTRHLQAATNLTIENSVKGAVEPESEVVSFSMIVDKMPAKLATQSTTSQRIRTSRKPSLSTSSVPKARKIGVLQKLEKVCDPGICDLDSDHKDPQLCALYAPDIYNHLRVAELNRRPSPDYMETRQQEIFQSMRGILVDWLVEVSEEYKLVPDTLYLTVYLIDWFLSNNLIEKQRLQLLGITCMLLASKYEEICAPRVEEFCFVTDNTYTKEEVLKMETQVLTNVNFQLFTPTAKGFLRRFVRAAQASHESPCAELECLADYLTELTLIDYNFLKFLPSVVAASAVFLAKWTLDSSTLPWNATLEHYTLYKPSDLKSSVLALQDLQLNTNNCRLNVIRAKYSQQKFLSVAALSSPKLPERVF